MNYTILQTLTDITDKQWYQDVMHVIGYNKGDWRVIKTGTL